MVTPGYSPQAIKRSEAFAINISLLKLNACRDSIFKIKGEKVL